MTTVHLFPIHRWREADPDRIIDHACEQGMDLDEAYAFIDQIAKRLDGRMRRMGIPPEQRRAALDDWNLELCGGLIWVIIGEPRDQKAL